jgi:hypothetical protein
MRCHDTMALLRCSPFYVFIWESIKDAKQTGTQHCVKSVTIREQLLKLNDSKNNNNLTSYYDYYLNCNGPVQTKEFYACYK